MDKTETTGRRLLRYVQIIQYLKEGEEPHAVLVNSNLRNPFIRYWSMDIQNAKKKTKLFNFSQWTEHFWASFLHFYHAFHI